MKYGICELSIVPGRLEPADQSEMITQLLFGDHYKVIDERAKWVKVRNGFDNYECWICKKQHTEVTAKTYKDIEGQKQVALCGDLTQPIQELKSRAITPIVLGSSLPLMKRNNQFSIGENDYVYIGSAQRPKSPNREQLVEFANMYLNTPYLWGGRSPFGIDCSGFVQLVYKQCGIALPRDAYQQAEVGNTLSFVEEAEKGDLAYFDNNEGHITHVGIILENNYIIHASGKVRVDRLDHQGIYNAETNSYTHKLRIIKQVI